MPNSPKNGMPAYRQIQATIIKRIENGSLKPGDAVDSERELAKIHQVSLMTARHALTALEREGLVHRRRGAGTFVAPPKIHFNKLTSFTEQMAGRSLAACSKVLSFGLVDNEQEVAAKLGLAAHARLLKIERLRLAADEPFAVETCYLPADEFGGLNRSLVARGSLFSILEGAYEIQIAYADEEMDATAAAPATANLLRVERNEPLLRIRQVIYSTKGKAVLYVLGLYRSDRHTLLVRRFR
ncbi:MAG: GntR family transcriptional regulator [Terriglobales bacterium]|jgi:GntR family transcriptional regulator